MSFAIYLPSDGPSRLPALLFLSGLTCSPGNFATKAAAYEYAAKEGVALIIPDTSPREEIAQTHWSFGTGASFYLDAVQEPWSAHWQMESYITGELLDTVSEHFPIDTRKVALFGHSMGGMGALHLGLRHQRFCSVSAFSPIAHPTHPECEWGMNAFKGYLGESDPDSWKQYDPSCLVRSGAGAHLRGDILVDQGTDDQFLKDLMTDTLVEAGKDPNAKVKLNVRMQSGYDHSYYFISTFVGDHIRHHAPLVKAALAEEQ